MNQHIVALVGTPNSGKTALFNALTGSHQKVGNYPGVTVDKKTGTINHPNGDVSKIIDLPGTYSLNPHSPDEQVTVDVLNSENENSPDIIVAVADAANLAGTLSLSLDLLALNKPVIVVLNMIDLAEKRGLKLDLNKLESILGCKVLTTVATKKIGIDQLVEQVASLSSTTNTTPAAKEQTKVSATETIEQRFKRIDEIIRSSVSTPASADLWSAKLDKVFLNPILGPIILAVGMLFIFQAVFSWAEAPMELSEQFIEWLGLQTTKVIPDGLLQGVIVDGVIAGVGSVIVFLPQILILFFFIFILEGSGYMARAAFILDRLMAIIGLQGRSFVPLLSSFACAIPGIMAARTVKSPRERLITIMVAPFMTCAARLPIYVLLIGAFIPNQIVLGVFNLQGLVMFGLFLAGIITAIAMAALLKQTINRGAKSSFLLELPTYKWPSPHNVAKSIWLRAKYFLRRAGTIILTVSVSLWVISTFPTPPEDWDEPAINYSLAGRIGHAIEPLVQPLGFDWRIATGLIPGFAAREVMVGALATVFAVEAKNEDQQAESLAIKIREAWGLPTGLSLLVWYIFSPQCLATFAVVRKETNSRKIPIIMFSYMLGLAFIFSMITYRLTLFIVS